MCKWMRWLGVAAFLLGLTTSVGVTRVSAKACSVTMDDECEALGKICVNDSNGPRCEDPATEEELRADPCLRLPETARESCWACMHPEMGGQQPQTAAEIGRPSGFWTAIGCVSTKPSTAIQQILSVALGISVFVVISQIFLGGFELVTSRGDPGKLQNAKERITNSVLALLFVIFSVALLEFLGVHVLELPGFFNAASEISTS